MSKIDPIYVYNKHRSPVSTMCFGKLNDRPVIVTGSYDGEIHVWNLINYSTLIKLQIHPNKVVGLESFKNDEHTMSIAEYTNQKSGDLNATVKNRLKTNQTNSGSKSRTGFLQFISQAKSGQLTFIHVLEDEQIIKYEIHKEIKCSNCTFCPFQVVTIEAYLFMVCISSKSNNCVNLVIMNGESEIVNESIITIDQNYGMISSMRMKMNETGLLLLMLGTESGCCLVFTSRLDSNDRTSKCQTDSKHKLIDESIDAFKNGFILKFEQRVFKDTFISSIELNDSLAPFIQLICGSVEDCLAVLSFELKDLTSSEDVQSTNDLQSTDSKLNIDTKEQALLLKLVDQAKYLKLTNKGINAIVRREDNKLLATCGWDGRIRIFSMKSLNALAVLTFHKQTIETIKFSPCLPHSNAYLLVAAGQDKLVTLWSIYNC